MPRVHKTRWGSAMISGWTSNFWINYSWYLQTGESSWVTFLAPPWASGGLTLRFTTLYRMILNCGMRSPTSIFWYLTCYRGAETLRMSSELSGRHKSKQFQSFPLFKLGLLLPDLLLLDPPLLDHLPPGTLLDIVDPWVLPLFLSINHLTVTRTLPTYLYDARPTLLVLKYSLSITFCS